MAFSHGSNKSKESTTLTSHKFHQNVSLAISTHCLIVANGISNTDNLTSCLGVRRFSSFHMASYHAIGFRFSMSYSMRSSSPSLERNQCLLQNSDRLKSRQLHTELNPDNVAILLYRFPKRGIKKLS